MSESALLAGVAGVVEWNGRPYEVGLRTLDAEGAFSVWARKEALREIMRSKDDFPPAMQGYFLLRLKHNADTAAFTFAWGGEGCEAARWSDLGQRQMFFMLLQLRDPSVKRELVDEMAKDPPTRELIARYTVGDLDPNRPAPQSPGQP